MRNNEYNIRFGGDMLPTMLHAVMIARNSTLGCPGGKPVMARLQAMYDDLARDCGIPNLSRAVDEYRWFAACNALARARAFHWYVQTGGAYGRDDVTIIVDGRQYKLEFTLPADTPNLGRIQEFLERHAHMDAVKGETVTNWREYVPPKAAEAEEPAGAPAP